MPLLELKMLEIQFSALFSYMLSHIELKFCTWLCFIVLQIKFEFHKFASVFFRSNAPLELRILEIHISLNFSPTCFDMLSWNCSYDFVSCTIDQVLVSSLCVRLALRSSVHFLRFPSTCIDKSSWNLKCDVGFFYAFLLEKYYINIPEHRKRCIIRPSWTFQKAIFI